MRRLIASSPLLAVLAVPAGAGAQAPAPPPVDVAASAPGYLRVAVQRTEPGRVVLEGSRFRVRGTMVPYVAGQKVTVRLYRGTHRLRATGVTMRPSASGRSGSFMVGMSAATAGALTVRASHRATPAQRTAVAPAVRLRAVAARAIPGGRGPAVTILQRHLSAQGYVTGEAGLYDARTQRAVLAFRKVTGMDRTTEAGPAVFSKLIAGAGAFPVRFGDHGRHAEADLSLQVLALIGQGGQVERIYPISSGKASTPTVLGSFRVYMREPGTNSHGMVFSSYFIRGYAIHGYAEVPTFPASHGCLRVPVPDAVGIYEWVRMGTRVDVYS